MAQGSLIPKGTGFPDYHHRPFGTMSVSVRSGSVEISGTVEHIRRIGTVGYLGTQRYTGRIGTAGRLGTVGQITTGSLGHVTSIGSLTRVGRVGTVGGLGTLRYVQAGSLGHVTGVGTLARAGRLGTVGNLGTLRYVQAGSLGHVTSIGTVGRVGRVGTVQGVGTVRYLRAGSLGRVERVGTVGQVGRVGTAHVGTVPTQVFSRRGAYFAIRGNVRLGAGSTWVGSWQHVGSYHTKTAVFNVGNPGTSGGGSIALITGAVGTSPGLTGTLFGPARIGKGTYTPLDFTSAVRYVRPWIRQHGAGAVATHGGTVSFELVGKP